MSNGKIIQCKIKSAQCHYKCCTFTNNYIVLYPGEFEKSTKKKSHLKIIDNNYYGGKKAVCTRHCTAADFKSLDCQSYPFFPYINSKRGIKILKGEKCPLTDDDLASHRRWFLKKWITLRKNPKIKEWIQKVELVGYERYL